MSKQLGNILQGNLTVSILNEIDTHGFVRFIAATDVKLTVKARSDKRPLPEHLRGLKKVVNTTASLKHDYEDAVNNRLEKNGLERSFEAEESSVSNPDPQSLNGILRMGKRDESQKYLRLFFFSKHVAYEEKYINEKGEIVVPTAEEKEDFFPVKSESKKQLDHGLESEQQVVIREYKIENILYFQKGQVVFNKLSNKIMNIFNLEYV